MVIHILIIYFESQSGGGRYNIQTGRRDGFESRASNVDLPAPSISVTQSVAAFDILGLNATDMVYLLGTKQLIHTQPLFFLFF